MSPMNTRLSSCHDLWQDECLRGMSELKVTIADGRIAFSPGETIGGTVAWEIEAPPKKAELDLIWSTQGKGTTDIEIVQTVPFFQPQARDNRPFTIKLPESPYSFSGQLISLLWNLELNLDPGDHSRAIEITIAPGGREVMLPRIQPAS